MTESLLHMSFVSAYFFTFSQTMIFFVFLPQCNICVFSLFFQQQRSTVINFKMQ